MTRILFPAPMNQETMKTEQAQGGTDPYCERGWNKSHRKYACRDGEPIAVPHRSAEVRDLDETKTLPANAVCYAPRSELLITASGT